MSEVIQQSDLVLTPDSFKPLPQAKDVQGISRPSLSYWQDAWRRLKENSRAIISLYIILGLLAFTLIGPLLWTIESSTADVDQISQPPFANRSATIVEPFKPWNLANASRSDNGLRVNGTPTTQSVRLAWEPMPGAVNGYRIYRNTYPIGKERALGLPLGEVFPSEGPFFEDRLDLAPTHYYYTVVALDENSGETTEFQSNEFDVIRVLTADEAVEKGLVASADDVAPGDELKLRWHPLGTDYLGRDMLARLMEGARVSLFIGIVAPLLYVLIGILYGSTAGFIGGPVDQGMMRFADFVVALPFLLFMIVFKIAFGVESGDNGIVPMLIAMVVLLWPATARLVRGQILQIREEGYIDASRLLGAKSSYLIGRHMIPNTMGVILVTLTFAVPSAIFTEAFLSFIGMGVAPPTPSWGSMCNEGLKTMNSTPHELVFPALLISITVLAFNMLGDGLRDALDARMRSRE